MGIIANEDNKSFRIVAVFLILTGLWVAGAAIVQHNQNSLFLGTAFAALSVAATVAIFNHKYRAAKIIWGFGTPIVVLIACVIVPVNTSSIIVTYGDALIGGSAFVYYSYSEKENKIALAALMLFTLTLFSYDYLIYNNARNPVDFDFYDKFQTHLKSNQLLHYFSIIYFVHIVRKNKFRIQNQLTEQVERLKMFTERLIGISKDKALYGGLIEESVFEIAKYTSLIAGVSRVSIWKYEEDTNVIRYVSGYNSNPQEGFSSKELFLSHYPQYTSHILNKEIVRAGDAVNDNKTNELKEYLNQNNILSMMDCPVFVEGKFVGILCCEEQRQHRSWDEVDQLFCQAMAQLVSIAYYSASRSEYYNEIFLLNKKLTERNKVLKEINEKIITTSGASDSSLQEFMSDTESLKKALGEYSYRNSHQVRGPLSRILGLISLYKKDESVENRNIYFDHIEKSAHELDTIIKEINILLSSENRAG